VQPLPSSSFLAVGITKRFVSAALVPPTTHFARPGRAGEVPRAGWARMRRQSLPVFDTLRHYVADEGTITAFGKPLPPG